MWDEDRYRWGPFERIPDSSFAKIAASAFYGDDEVEQGAPFVAERRVHGGNNLVVILSNGSSKVIVKVPVNGTKERWNREHVPILVSEVATMWWIKDRLPDFPIADVLAYDAGFDNAIGTPYTCQSFIEGRSAVEIWYAHKESGNTEEDEKIDLSGSIQPSEQCEQRRRTFLRSLAHTMAQLQSVSVNSTGMLQFIDPFDEVMMDSLVGRVEGLSLEDPVQYWGVPPLETASEFWQQRLAQLFSDSTNSWSKGVNLIFRLIVGSPAFARSNASPGNEQEFFTLHHPGIDLHNILVAEDGTVRGIIDWDGAFFGPRCVGPISLPCLLQLDWTPLASSQPAGRLQQIDKYRKIYTDAMIEACGGPFTDARYTYKSGLYNAVVFTLISSFGQALWEKAEIFIQRVFEEIPGLGDFDEDSGSLCSRGLYEYLEKIGDGSPEDRKLLEEWIPKIFDHQVA